MEFNEEDLVEQLKLKNPDTLQFVIDTYGSSVYWLVNRILNGSCEEEDIEECVSDIFVDVWNNIFSFDKGRGSFKTWLLIRAKYRALDYRRRLNRTAFDRENNSGLQIRAADANLEAEVISGETREALIKAIRELNEIDRQIIVKRYFLYESVENIARQLDLTRQAVDNRLWRSRSALRKLLQLNGKEGLI